MALYFDTCVWISYVNATLFEGNKFRKAQFVLDFFEILYKDKKAKVFFSYFNFIEFSEVLKDALISLRLLGEGHSVHNLSREKKNNSNASLLKDEQEKFDEILAEITSFHFLQPQIDSPQEMTTAMMEDLYSLTSAFHVEMPDAFHLLYAIKNNCDVFVTNDRSLIRSYAKAQEAHPKFKKLQVRSVEEILNHSSLIR